MQTPFREVTAASALAAVPSEVGREAVNGLSRLLLTA